MAHGYPSKSKIRSYFIKRFMMNKTTFHTGAKGRLLEHLLHFQEGGGCSLYMHPDTRSVKCTFPGANPESDVVCVCVGPVAQSVVCVNGYH